MSASGRKRTLSKQSLRADFVACGNEVPQIGNTSDSEWLVSILWIPQHRYGQFRAPSKKISDPVIAEPDNVLQARWIPILCPQPGVYRFNVAPILSGLREHKPYTW